jgi:hypothetical protein
MYIYIRIYMQMHKFTCSLRQHIASMDEVRDVRGQKLGRQVNKLRQLSTDFNLALEVCHNQSVSKRVCVRACDDMYVYMYVCVYIYIYIYIYIY